MFLVGGCGGNVSFGLMLVFNCGLFVGLFVFWCCCWCGFFVSGMYCGGWWGWSKMWGFGCIGNFFDCFGWGDWESLGGFFNYVVFDVGFCFFIFNWDGGYIGFGNREEEFGFDIGVGEFFYGCFDSIF